MCTAILELDVAEVSSSSDYGMFPYGVPGLRQQIRHGRFDRECWLWCWARWIGYKELLCLLTV